MAVKDAITELCKLVKLAKTPANVTPEDFRLAKINSSKSIASMMKLLIIIMSHIDPSCKSNPLNMKDMEAVLLKLRYPRLATLLNGKDRKITSNREVLFCIAYCLSCSKYLVAIVNDESLTAIDPYHLLYNHHDDRNTSSSDSTHKSRHNLRKLELHDRINYITSLVHKLHLWYDRLLTIKTEMKMADMKIDERVGASGDNNFSASNQINSLTTSHQVLLIKHPHLVDQVISKLKRKCQILKSFVKWKEHEACFWNWLKGSLPPQVSMEDDGRWEEMKITQFPFARSSLSSFHHSFSQLVPTLKEKQHHLIETDHNQQTRKLGIEEELAVKKEVDELFFNITDVHLQPRLQLTDGAKESAGNRIKVHYKLSEVGETLNSIHHVVRQDYEDNIEKNESVLLDMFASSELGDSAVIMPVKPTYNRR